MKKILILCMAAISFYGCKKTSTECPYTESSTVATAAEIAEIQTYLTSQGISSATQHASGLFYEITNPGSGSRPGLCSGINVKYQGKLKNGTVFDANTTGVSFTLGNLIIGWQKGLPLIGKGGTIRLFVPPSLGYGSQQAGSIPPNSMLIFDLQLVDVF